MKNSEKSDENFNKTWNYKKTYKIVTKLTHNYKMMN